MNTKTIGRMIRRASRFANTVARPGLTLAIVLVLLSQFIGIPLSLAATGDSHGDNKPAASKPDSPTRTNPPPLSPAETSSVEAALVNHAPVLAGRVEGSVRQLSREDVTLASGAAITSALMAPGIPRVQTKTGARLGSTTQGRGSAQPADYTLTLNNGASLGRLVTRVDPVALPVVSAPTTPVGKTSVTINSPGQIPASFTGIKDLTLAANVGDVSVPPGAYGDLSAASGSGFTFGVAGSIKPSHYDLASLNLPAGAFLRIAGPVALTLGSGLTLSSSVGLPSNSNALTIDIASGGLTLDPSVSLYALVHAPQGSITLKEKSLLKGSVAADRLSVAAGARLQGQSGTIVSVSPSSGAAGQSLTVTLTGQNTQWSPNDTIMSMGPGISVGGAPAGTMGAVNVQSATSATASITISSTASFGPQTVTMFTQIVNTNGTETDTLTNGFTITASSAPGASSSTVSTIAGVGGAPGFANGSGSQAEFNAPAGVAVGSDGTIYVADAGNNRIRQIQNQSGTWTVSTLAGSGSAGFADGAAASAEFNNPQGIAVDSSNKVYVADTGNHRIREISGGNVSTIGGNGTAGLVNGAASSSEFKAPQGLTVDSQGNVYVADTGNSTVRFISTAGQVSSVAGDGTVGSNDSPSAHFNGVIGIGFDGITAYIYLADTKNERIRRLDSSGNVMTLTGSTQGFADGSASVAQFANPAGIAIDGAGKIIVTDSTNSLIREVDPTQVASNGPNAVFTLAGTGARALTNGAGNVAAFFTPAGVAVSPSSAIIVADTGNNVIRQILVPPIIDSFSPTTGNPGDSITINGERFDSTSASNDTVTFTAAAGGTVAATVTAATRNQLTVTVPAGVGTGPITVTTAGGTATSSTNFGPGAANAPSITGFAPTSGEVGSAVTLTGTNFTTPAGGTTVTFAGSGNAIPALITSLTSTSATVLVPNGAMTGLITLTTSGGSAQIPTPFTVSPGQQDYQLTVTPSTASVVLGSSTNYVVYLTSALTTFSQLATLSTSGLPSGVTVTFTPQQITAGATSTLNLNLSGSSLSPGSYNFTISSSALVNGAPLTRSAPATLTVLSTGQTTLSGRVLSSDDQPLLGVTVSLDGQTATTDAAGGFLLFGINAGTNRPLMINGSTASAANQTYPIITEPANVVAGQANQIPYNFYLPAIDTQYETVVNPNATTMVSNPRVPGLQMTIPAGANLTNRDGTPVSTVSITPVPPDKAPAPLPSNLSLQLLYTSQPGAATSSKPIPVVYPNLAGLNPGTVVPLYNFNHDTVQWEQYGTGQVSADGRTIAPQTNPSTGQPYGLMNFSWHGPSAASGGDSNQSCGGWLQNPVDLSTGQKLEFETDISFGGTRGGLTLQRVFTSDLAATDVFGRFGRGWKDSYDVELTASAFTQGGAGRVIFPEEETGRLFSYTGTNPDGSMTFANGSRDYLLGDVLTKNSAGTFQYRYKNGSVMQFNASGVLTAFVDRNGNQTALTYSGGNLTQITDAVGRSIALNYTTDKGHQVVSSVTDPIGRTWNYIYTDANVLGGCQLASVTDPLGFSEKYGYNLFALTSITDKRGNVAKRIAYDSSNRVISETFADGGVESISYSLSGTIVTSATVTDPMGRVSSVRFSGAGYTLQRTDPLGQTTQFQRDIGTNLLLSTIGPCGCTEVTQTYDANGNVLTRTDRLGNTETFQYELIFNNVTQYTDKLGNVTNFSYDESGNLLQTARPLTSTTTYSYDGSGERISSTDPVGNTITYGYDPYGSLQTITDALNETTTLAHDMIGRLTSSTDPMGRQTSVSYNALYTTVMTDTASASTNYTYDNNGNTLTVTDALGDRTTRVYDPKNRLVSSTDPLGQTTSFTYDLDDELIIRVSPSGRTAQYAYDARGEPAQVTDPLNGTVRFSYDDAMDLVQLTDQRGFSTSYTYDQLYRPNSRMDPDGAVSTTSYDADGNVSSVVDRLGRQVSVTYDQLNRATNAQYADASVNYSYDLASKMTEIADASGSIAWIYDQANRVTAETTAGGTVNYTYNSASQRQTMTAASRPVVNYGYDSAGRIQTIAQGSDTFTFSYDSLSRRSGLSRPNGVNTAYSYDAASRLIEELHGSGQAQPVEDLKFSYDPDNEIVSMGSVASAQQLPAPQTVGTADPANRIGQFGPASFTFDAMGQITSRTDSTGATNYTWDARGRLTSAALPSGQTVSYTYDPAGRRTSSTSGGVTTNYLYDGRNVVLDTGSDGTVTSYLNGPVLDEKLKQAQDGSSPLYFAQSQIQSTAALLDSNGNIVEQDQYEAFGKNTASSLTRYQFTGRELDSSSNLLYYRARWYDPGQGRFLSEDPIGFTGGIDLYSYVFDNPVSRVDPLGLAPCISKYIAGGAAIGGLLEGLVGAGVGAAAGGFVLDEFTIPAFSLAGAAKGAVEGAIVGGIVGIFACTDAPPCGKVIPFPQRQPAPRPSPSPSPSPSPTPHPRDDPRCRELLDECIKECLPSLPGSQGFNFRNCIRKCMADGGCEGFSTSY